MSDRSLTWLGRSVAIGTLALGAIAVIIVATSVPIDRVSPGQIQALSGTVIVPVIVLIVLPQVPRNGSIWAFAVTGAALALSTIGDAVALAISDISSADITDSMASGAAAILTAPADLPLAASIGLVLSMTMWVPSFLLIPTTVLLLFPEGRYPRRERWWRWIGIVTIATFAIGIPALMWQHRPSSTIGYTEIQGGGGGGFVAAVAGIAGLVAVLLVIASIIGFIVKWRQSEGEQRIQYRWVGFVFLVFAIWQVVTVFLGGLEVIDSRILDVVSWLNIVAIVVAYAVAITKYRLYDIDLVISRTLVYGLLVAMIAVAYVAIVAGPLLILGETDGAETEPAPLLAIVATALIAIAFQPVRRSLERLANRLVYGKRATPYEVLSEFSRRVAATDDELLELVPDSLVAGTGAETAALWVYHGTAWTRIAVHPDGAGAEPFPGLEESENGLICVPVEHDGETMGAVTLRAPRLQRLSPEDERLARQVASGMGLALRNQRLTEDLRQRIVALRDSRRRIVQVQDRTRRHLERDLHDGAQQRLVAVKVKLGIARQLADRDAADGTRDAIESIAARADEAIDDMRTFARGIYPPLLEAEGLVAAVTAHVRRLPIQIDVRTTDVERYDREIESTVFFCVVEALRNVVTHAAANQATVEIVHTNDALLFRVGDPGPGFDTMSVSPGAGLRMITDRLDILDGAASIDSHPGGPTTVSGLIPLRTAAHSSPPEEGEGHSPTGEVAARLHPLSVDAAAQTGGERT